MSAPVTVGGAPTQGHAPSAVVSLPMAPFFTDADATATKSYSATGLPTGLSIDTSTGAVTGTPSVSDTYDVAITCTPSAGTPATLEFVWIISGAPAAAQNYYIDGTDGNDAWDGSSATFVSGTTGPWKTLPRANNVAAHASGHVDVWITPGTYYGVWQPANSGTDDTHRIRLRVNGTGVVVITGQSIGSLQHAIVIGSATQARNYISVMRESADSYVRIDGGVPFGTGAGEIGRGDAPETVARCAKAAYVNGVGVLLDLDTYRTAGWNGFEFGPSTDLFEWRCNCEQHGTCVYPPGNVDFGDLDWIGQNFLPGS